MFKAYDVRGKYGEEVTEENFIKLGKALNSFSNKLVLGSDFREKNDSLTKALFSGFEGEKISVGVAPTAAVCFISKDLGVSLTASHNPAGYNGAKFFLNRRPFFEEEMTRAKNNYSTQSTSASSSDSKFNNELLANYVNELPLAENGVFDLGGGAACVFAGLFPETIYSKPDPTYEKHSPEPTKDALIDLIKITKEKNCLGFAFDGDADRVAVVDSGEFIDSNILTAFLASKFAGKNDSIVVTLDISQEVVDFLRNQGLKVFPWMIGDVFVLKKAMQENAVFAAEKGGHYTFPNFLQHSDGIYVSCLLSRTKPGELIEFSKQFSSTSLYENLPGRVVQEKLLTAVTELNPLELISVDGVKAVFEDYSFFIRPSNTEPKTRLMAESKNSEKAKQAMSTALEIAKSCLG
ncbi:hypothetical protein HUU53_03580 [Candidatus Micrarchaeota archaeon]|nr:hypothetical protein [Candidatus Micrarchaeota archaeon]